VFEHHSATNRTCTVVRLDVRMVKRLAFFLMVLGTTTSMVITTVPSRLRISPGINRKRLDAFLARQPRPLYSWVHTQHNNASTSFTRLWPTVVRIRKHRPVRAVNARVTAHSAAISSNSAIINSPWGELLLAYLVSGFISTVSSAALDCWRSMSSHSPRRHGRGMERPNLDLSPSEVPQQGRAAPSGYADQLASLLHSEAQRLSRDLLAAPGSGSVTARLAEWQHTRAPLIDWVSSRYVAAWASSPLVAPCHSNYSIGEAVGESLNLMRQRGEVGLTLRQSLRKAPLSVCKLAMNCFFFQVLSLLPPRKRKVRLRLLPALLSSASNVLDSTSPPTPRRCRTASRGTSLHLSRPLPLD